MLNNDALINILRINGINETSSVSQLNTVLDAFKYSPEEKQKTFEALRMKGWFAAETVSSPIIAESNPLDTSTNSLTTPNQPIQPEARIPTIISMPQRPENPQQLTSTETPSAIITNNLTPSQNKPKGRGVLYFGIFIFILIIIGAGYFYLDKTGFFLKGTYNESNFISAILEKSKEINSSTYEVSSSITVTPRDGDAKPFVLPVNKQNDITEKYNNDVTRTKDIDGILSYLKMNYGATTAFEYDNVTKQYKSVTKPGKPFPNSISSIAPKAGSFNSFKITDPLSNTPYKYSVTENGKNFNLTANYETDVAVSQIKKYYGYVATSTIINNLSITFTKDSPNYLYISSTLPEPFLVQMANTVKMLSNDASANLSLGGTMDLSKQVANWLFNVKASGSFGDMTYAVDVESRKVSDNYYIRINKIPDIFGSFSLLKNKWIFVNKDTASSTSDGGEIGLVTQSFTSGESNLKENREKFINLIKEISQIADDKKLISFRSSPKKDSINGQTLIKYDLELNKDNIVPFYKELLSKSSTNKDLTGLVDEGTLSYLKGEEFNSVMDYTNKNIFVSLWVDKNNFPTVLEIRFRIVPPDTATQFEGKQVNLIFRITLSEINKPVSINVPPNATPIQKIIEDMNKNTNKI